MTPEATTKNSRSLLTNHKAAWVDSDTLGAIIRFIDSDKPISQFKHVVSKTANEFYFFCLKR